MVDELIKAIEIGSVGTELKFESLDISLKYLLYFPISKTRSGSLKYLKFCKKYNYKLGTTIKVKFKGGMIKPSDWSKDLKLWKSLPKSI